MPTLIYFGVESREGDLFVWQQVRSWSFTSWDFSEYLTYFVHVDGRPLGYHVLLIQFMGEVAYHPVKGGHVNRFVTVQFPVYMFVVSGHLYRPLL